MWSQLEKDALDRYELILSILRKYKGPEKKKNALLKLLESLVRRCTSYIQAVTRIETFGRVQRFRMEPEDFREKLVELDKRRRLAHNALLADLSALNRNLFKDDLLREEVPPGGIFSLDPSLMGERSIVGDWAGYLVKALYHTRKR